METIFVKQWCEIGVRKKYDLFQLYIYYLFYIRKDFKKNDKTLVMESLMFAIYFFVLFFLF